MIYKFNYEYKYFEGFKKKLRLPALIFAAIPVICVCIICFLFDYKYSFLTPFKNNFDIIMTSFICLGFLMVIYYSFYNSLLISLYKRLMPPNNEPRVAILNNDYLVISSKNIDNKIFFNEIINADFSDLEITIKTNNGIFIIPLYFEGGENFSDLLYDSL